MGNEGAIPPHYLNTIVTGDARVLAEALPDNSVDLIFTDPVYWQIADYEWLSELAARVLVPGGELLTYYGQYYFYETVVALGRHLRVAWPLTEKKIGGSAWIWAYSISSEVKPLLWCIKGKPDRSIHRIDHQFAPPDGKGNHKWHKGNSKVSRWMIHFSHPGALVLDPFCGGGTVPTVCKMLGRQYIAFEIDAVTADNARQRILNTQPPLPLVYNNQLELSFDT